MVFSALTETSYRKSVHTAAKKTSKSIKLAILQVIYKSRNFTDVCMVGGTFLPLKSLSDLIIQGPFSSNVDGYSLTALYQKLRKPWKGLLSLPRNEIPNYSLPLQLDKK